MAGRPKEKEEEELRKQRMFCLSKEESAGIDKIKKAGGYESRSAVVRAGILLLGKKGLKEK